MSWLALVYFLSFGSMSYQGQVAFDWGIIDTIMTTPGTFETTFGTEAQMFDNHVFVGGSVETWESFNGELFTPTESFYDFSVGLRGWGFELGWKHECVHLTIEGWAVPNSGFISNRNELYLSYTGKLKVF